MVPVRFPLEAIMVEMTSIGKIRMVLPVKAGMIMMVVCAVMVVTMPGGIGIIRISRISGLIDANLHMHLRIGRIDRKRRYYDHANNK